MSDDALRYRLANAMELSENEKAVLAVLQSNKHAKNVSEIARQAGVPRTTAVYILKKFQKWKLARAVTYKKRRLWRNHWQ